MLAVYNDDSKIASDSNSYNLINDEQSIENQNYEGSIEKFEGMDTIWTYDAMEDINLDIEYQVSVHTGKMKLVLIAPDDTLTTIVEVTPKNTMKNIENTTLELKKGKNRIKVVGGKNTKLDLDISIPEGEFSNLG
jgi:hypothetical protein